jgi:ABC-type multidrug transport system permease subunit
LNRLGIERLGVIVKREIKIKLSYKLTMLVAVVSVFSGLLSYAFLGNGAVVSVTSQEYGMSLAAFLVSGVAFSSIVNNGLSMFGEFANASQIEEVLVTPTDFRLFVLYSSMLSILVGLGSAALLFLVTTLVLGLTFSYNFALLFAVIILGVTSSIGMGFIGLGFQLVYKQTYFLSWLLSSFSSLVGNMIVPVQVLPSFLQAASYVTPQYYFFTGIRVALGSTVAPAYTILGTFLIYSVLLLFLGLLSFRHGLKFIRQNGTHRWT